MYEALKGIIFLGTLNNHSLNNFENLSYQTAGIELECGKNHPIVQALKKVETIQQIREAREVFAKSSIVNRCISYFEERKTVLKASRVKFREKSSVVGTHRQDSLF